MTENELFELVRTSMLARLTAHGFPAQPTTVVRGYQVSQQGRNEGPTLYINRQALHQHGSPRDTHVKDLTDDKIVGRISEQVVEVQIQFMASVAYNPTDGLRPADLLGLASRIMGTLAWRTLLREQGVSMLRVLDNQQTFRVNDRDQFEPVPVLLATFTFTDELRDVSPVVTTSRYRIERV